MDTKSFTPVKAASLTVNDLHALVAFIIVAATLVKDKFNVLLLAILNDMEAKNTTKGTQLNKVTASPATQKIKAADKDRDGWVTEIERKTETARKSRDTAQSEAGTEMKIFLTPYWDVARKSLNTESKDLIQLIAKYKANTTIQAHAATIGIADMFTHLEEANNVVVSLYEGRSNELAANNGPSATSVKGPVAQTFNHFCSALVMAEAYTPSEALTNLYNKIENERKKYVGRSVSDDQEDTSNDASTDSVTNPT